MCSYDGKIYVLGGCESWTCTNSFLCYDPEVDEWLNMPPMTVPRRGAGVAIFDGKLSQRLLIFNVINYFVCIHDPTFC